MYKKTVLENGLTILTVPRHETKAVTVLILVGTGSKYEDKNNNGISHFLEHMFFKGTEKRPNTMAISDPLDRAGGIFNAFTGEEYTGYWAKVEASQFDLALDVVSDIFLNSKLEQEEIEKERGVIIEEINMYYDNPMSHVQLLWEKLLYGDQPAGWDIAGPKENILKFQRKDFADYMNSQYVAKNTIICIAGNINEDEAIEKAKKYLSNIRTGEFKDKVLVVEKQTDPQVELKYKETDQTHLLIGFRGVSLASEDEYKQKILATILGGMMSSRMFMSVREKQGLTYYISTASDTFTDTGYIVTRAGVDNKRVFLAVKAILEEYKKIMDDGVPEEELKKAKENIKGKMALTFEASDAEASFYGAQLLLEKKIKTPEEIFAEIDKIDAVDIQNFAKQIFTNDKLNLALIGPFKEEEEFKKILKI
ncbi:MAG TPA: pitrilysin family protein [Candidatus Pacearchaeota archaeon]|jgi:predicted Zn-dependent peptidase|nr:pitrilysin family protein [Candidatus Pacearchaeota archaeon]HQI74322.1 pitrilysin family protein [Candidatus Pacearchaeota archaeon]